MKYWLLVLALACEIFHCNARAAVEVSSNTVDLGWYTSSGRHQSYNQNTLTGYSSEEYRSFYVWNVPQIDGRVTSARVDFYIEYSLGGSTIAQTGQMFDLTANSISTLTQEDGGGAGKSIFADLGDGNSYGSFTVPSWIGSPVQYTLSVELGAAAIDAINAANGTFAMGIKNTTPGNTNDYFIFSSMSVRAAQVLVLDIQPIPEPATNILMLLGFVAVVVAVSRSKDRSRYSRKAVQG